MLASDELKYVNVILRRAWIIILTAVIAGGITYTLQNREQPTYNAQALLSVGNPIEFADQGLIALREQLVQSYIRIVETTEVLQAVIDTLDLPLTARELRSQVSASAVDGTSFLNVRATSEDREVAAEIANALAQYLVENDISLSPEEQDTLASLEFQIEELNQQIDASRQQLTEINERLQASAEENETIMLESQRGQVIDQINTALANVGAFTNTMLTLSSRAISVQIVDPAEVPNSASGISPKIITVASALVGVILSTAVLLFLEFFNSTIRTEQEVQSVVGLNNLGAVKKSPELSKKHSEYIQQEKLYTLPIIENYRNIKAALLFNPSHKSKVRAYIIASSNPKEGRTFTAVNLALAMSEASARVLLIDADLRKPEMHQLFGLENNRGVAQLLEMAESASEKVLAQVLQESIQRLKNPRLSVMTSGIQSAGVEGGGYNFKLFQVFLDHIIESGNYDTIIIDTPASAKVADCYILAASLQADIVLVVEAGASTTDQTLKTKEQFIKLGNGIMGVVLNKAK